jgi:TROVE domain
MSSLNKKGDQPAPRGPMATAMPMHADAKTYGGASAFTRSLKTEVFLRATTVFAGEGQFYENAAKADDRLRYLTTELATIEDGFQWQCDFLPWLRREGNIRTATLIQAVDAVMVRVDNKMSSQKTAANALGFHRQLINHVMQRPDEPVEIMAYFLTQYPGRIMPKPLKRALADAAVRMWDERAVLRYDKSSNAVRFADLIMMCHPKPKATWQKVLFKHLLDQRFGKKLSTGDPLPPPTFLTAIRERWELNHVPPLMRHEMGHTVLSNRPTVLKENTRKQLELAMAGQWEWLRSWLGEPWSAEDLNHEGILLEKDISPLTNAQQWQLAVPYMGYMAILRNLRNFDDAGLPDSLANKITTRIASAEEVSRSGMFPFQFLSAYLNTPGSFRWDHALEQAINYSAPNIPSLPGNSLILIDTSGSMTQNKLSNPDVHGRILRPGQHVPERPTRLVAAAVMALTLAKRNADRVNVWMFANEQRKLDGVSDVPILRGAETIHRQASAVGNGTEIAKAVQRTYAGEDRVFIFTDEQTFPDANGRWVNPHRGRQMYLDHFGDVSAAVPAHVPVYAFNTAGYEASAISTGNPNRFELGGLTDATFKMVANLEKGKNGHWPWEE